MYSTLYTYCTKLCLSGSRIQLALPSGIMKYAMVVALAIWLAACGSAPQKSDQTNVDSNTYSIDDAIKLIEEAKSSLPPTREAHYLKAVTILLELEENDWARNLFSEINPDSLTSQQFIEYTLLYSSIALKNDAYFLAQRILTNSRLEAQWANVDRDSALILRERRAGLFAILGETVTSVKERLLLADILDSEEQQEKNQEAIWQTLMTLPLEQLEQLSHSEKDPLLLGWYSLAALSKNNQTDLERQLEQVDRWIATWAEHPASLRLPNDLQLLRQLVQERPVQIALLLPFQGKWGKASQAIRDGFFAAYYDALNRQNTTPQVKLYDTSNADINTLYNQAVTEGAQVIIGPLDKENVTALSQREALPVPTLALNTVESTSGSAVELYQFGLSIEDEARQTARRAWLEGHRQAMILAPSSALGDRGVEAFTQQWQELGGLIVDSRRYTDQKSFSQVVKTGLHVQNSHDRAKQLRRRFGHRLEFEPRRRQDIDLLFLIANPSDGRQIKPTLAFHYAGDIPVYATSHIYTGMEDRKSDRDLNGIKFSTLPWFFDNSGSEKKVISQYSKPAAIYHSLYAMGVDTYRLYPRLKQLVQVPGSRFYGATGALRLTADSRIEREQVWAQIRAGRALPLPVVVSGPYLN